MPIPTHCPNCNASLSETMERFGANSVCKACGQILRFDEPFPAEEVFPARLPQERLPRQKEEDPEEDGEDSTDLPPIDQLLSEGWEIFKQNLGLCLGVTLLVNLINLVMQSPELIWTFYWQARMADPQTREMISIGIQIYSLIRVAFSIWISLGHMQFLLKVIRGQRAEVSDLFRGGDYFVRAMLCLIIFGLAVFAGTLLCVIPGIIVALMYGQFMFVLVDRDPSGINSLSLSAQLTDGKKVALFGLGLVCLAINLCGILALIVGVFFTSTFTSIVMALAYDHICGRPRKRLPDDDDDDEMSDG